ncbi:MAG: hypothetical protein ACO33Z_03535 [Pelagibacteraceae bacterium]
MRRSTSGGTSLDWAVTILFACSFGFGVSFNKESTASRMDRIEKLSSIC